MLGLVEFICRTVSAMGVYTILYTTWQRDLEGTARNNEELKNHVFQSIVLFFRPSQDVSRMAVGVPGRSRTCDLPLRRRLLYPTELQGLTSSKLAGA